MDIIETNSNCSSNSSSSTVIDQTWSSNTDVNLGNTLNENMYDLSEFAESSEISKISYINNDNCSEILQELSQKYFPTTSSSNASQPNNNEIIVLSDSLSDENSCGSNTSVNNIYEKQKIDSINNDSETIQTKSYFKADCTVSKNMFMEIDVRESDNMTPKLASSPKKRMGPYEKEIEKEEIIEKCNKKKKPKPSKDNKITKKSSNPDKLIEDIIVNIDNSIYKNAEYGSTIKEYLDSCCVTHRMMSSLTGIISWSRMCSTDSSISEQKEKHYLLVLMEHQFGSLKQLICNIKEQTDFHHLTILVYGVNKPTPAHEEEMIQIDMSFSVFWQFVLTKEDLASFVFMATKSVAQIPYKKDQEEKYKLQSEYFNDSNKDVVKIDKKGNGLSRLWRQMLTMFPLARLETAEAIEAVYPTMSSLFQAYKDSGDSGETLIQNLPIRRAHGHLASVKKLGPELSRKCYKYFTSAENIFL